MKYPYIIQMCKSSLSAPEPKNFLSGIIKNKEKVYWVNYSEQEFNTFEEAAAKCEKLITDKFFRSYELRIVEVVGTFDSQTTVSVNKKREVVMIPIIENVADEKI